MRSLPYLCFGLLASLLPTVVSAQVPQAQHVVVVLEENTAYSSVMGSAQMPYLNSLAKDFGYATQYYANTHPSIGNYMMLTTGQILTNNDGYTGTITADNLVRHFASTGKTWKSYAEGLPYTGYTGNDTGLYIKHHDPFVYFSDVLNSTAQKQNVVPFTQFASDVKNNTLPNYSFIVPNVCNDAHNCSLGTADTWLQNNIGPLLSNPTFQKTGIVLFVFDESVTADTAHGGGHIAMVAVGHSLKRGYASPNFYQHQNLLATVCSAVVLYGCPGAASTAATMSDLFTITDLPFVDVSKITVSYPTGGPQITIATDSNDALYAVTGMVAYLDGVQVAQSSSGILNATFAAKTGQHTLLVRAWNAKGSFASASRSFTV